MAFNISLNSSCKDASGIVAEITPFNILVRLAEICGRNWKIYSSVKD